MQIKRLALQGFKSFGDRLEIAFPAGLSGVVGPNGCGKSNIVDAIRWCMGEMSPKELRGRRMEDVIFNGARDVKPVGMAEVSLLLENDHDLAPGALADQAEILVTRRLYRSGESEYLLNHTPCRLKDILEMFMDTGLGNKAYAIIGQGKIGRILEQRPEDTRVLLEEAAGITKYRRRVEESRKRIAQTEANLLRVEDLLAELRKQMTSLKRQAARARRYKGVSAALRETELALYAGRYARLRRMAADQAVAHTEVVDQEAAAAGRLAVAGADIAAAATALHEQEGKVAQLRRRQAQIQERVRQQEAAVEAEGAEIRTLEEVARQLAGERARLEAQRVATVEERARLTAELAARQQERARHAAVVAACAERLKVLKTVCATLKADVEAKRGHLMGQRQREVGLTHDLQHVRRALEVLDASRRRIEGELGKVHARMERLTTTVGRRSREREALAGRLADIEVALTTESERAEESRRGLRAVEAERKAQEAACVRDETRLAGLKSLLDSFEGFKPSVRALMKAQGRPPLAAVAVLGLLADGVQVDPALETAVEASLEEGLQTIVVERVQQAREAIHFLMDRQRGRADFVALDAVPAPETRRPPKGLPRLLERLRVEPPFHAVMEAVMGHVVLVGSFDEAWAASTGNGRGWTYVTPDGEMVDDRGIVRGGRPAETHKGLLARRREIAELGTRVEGLRQDLERLGRQEAALARQEEERAARLGRMTAEREQVKEEINQQDRLLFRDAQEMEQLEKLVARLKGDAGQQTRSYEKNRREADGLDRALTTCRAEGARDEGLLGECEAELGRREMEVEALKDDLGARQTQAGVLLEAQRGLERELGRLTRDDEQSQARLAQIAAELAEGEARAAGRHGRRETLRAELADGYEHLQETQGRLDREMGSQTDLQARVEAAQQREKALRQELEALKEKVVLARMQRSELTLKQEHLEATARENLQVDLALVYAEHAVAEGDPEALEVRLNELRAQRQALGEVNLTAIPEFEAIQERHAFVQDQREDLLKSIASLKSAIRKLNQTSTARFLEVVTEVDLKLKEVFPILFSGGTASLRLTDESRPLESGVLVEVRPPGKKLSHMGLLSGGEKALVAMALLFAIYMIKPSPFCLLDEVDAPLDESNIDRFNNLLLELRKGSQIIMVTHNRRTMEIADYLFGVTMERPGVSTVVSLDMQRVKNPVP